MQIEKLRILYEKPSRIVVNLLIVISFVISLVLIILMRSGEEYLTGNTPYGVLDFEFMFTVDKAALIMEAWGQDGRLLSIYGTYLDMGFLITYSILIAFIHLKIIGFALRYGVINQSAISPMFLGFVLPFAAAFFDFIENVNLLIVLYNPIDIPLCSPLIASISASIKFGLLLVSVVFGLSLLLVSLFRGNKK